MKLNIGAWIGIAGGVIGIVVAIVSVLTTAGPEGIYIAGGIAIMGVGMFYLFYKLLFAPVILANRLQKTGIAARAFIQEVRDTGVTINNNPQVKLVLEISPPSGKKYTGTLRTLVSRIQPDRFQPGMEIPVLIDPRNEQVVVIDQRGDAGANFSNSMGPADQQKLKEDLMKFNEQDTLIRDSGRAARAIVKKYTWLGININGNNPFAELEIEVMPDDKPAFAATVKGAINAASVSKFQPGEEIFVKYDIYDQRKVAIDHS